MSNFGPKVGQIKIAPKWDKPNLKKSRMCPIRGLSDPLWTQISHVHRHYKYRPVVGQILPRAPRTAWSNCDYYPTENYWLDPCGWPLWRHYFIHSSATSAAQLQLYRRWHRWRGHRARPALHDEAREEDRHLWDQGETLYHLIVADCLLVIRASLGRNEDYFRWLDRQWSQS